jgi:hypothetical protein
MREQLADAAGRLGEQLSLADPKEPLPFSVSAPKARRLRQ